LLSLSQINQQSLDTRNRRNAQELAGICAAAQAAGVDFVAAGDLDQTINNVVTGGMPADGAFTGCFFGLPSLQTTDRAAAKAYLVLDSGSLHYRPQP
jgi:hypothetical protein